MNTSISLFFGLMMLQTFGAGCTAFVEVGDDSGDGGGKEAGPDDDANGTGSGGAGGGVSTGGSSSVGSGGNFSTGGSGGGISVEGSSSVGSGGGVGTGGSSSVGSGGSGSTGSGSGPATAGAIAFLGSQLPDPSGEPGSSSATGGGPSPAPDDLYVLIGAPALSCADPYPGCDAWHVRFIIPPAAQVPGVYTLNGQDLTSSFGVNGPDTGEDTCTAFGGTFAPGTLEIVSIDATKVVVRLSGTDTHGFDASGEYTAARCP
ncbi:hypothetical protein WME94_40170 [Sorangium sp. So ce429]